MPTTGVGAKSQQPISAYRKKRQSYSRRIACLMVILVCCEEVPYMSGEGVTDDPGIFGSGAFGSLSWPSEFRTHPPWFRQG